MAYNSNPMSFQLYLDSARASYMPDTTLRNKFSVSLNEPIIVPDNYILTVSVVSAEIPINWNVTPAYKYLLVGTNLKARNQYLKNLYIAKMPKTVGSGYRLLYTNLTDYKHPVSDRQVDVLEIGIYGENGQDLNVGTTTVVGGGIDWSITLEFGFVKK
jgi:hypothetical protein